jgi:hypothetical protein
MQKFVRLSIKVGRPTLVKEELLRITLFELSFTTLRVFNLFRSLHCLC